MTRIVLASSSASRRSILQQAGVTPIVHPADIDEDALLASLSNKEPSEVVAALAQAKAAAIAPKYPSNVVIACDSMLLIDGVLQGKPHTVDAAIERWKHQRGKQATLLTGHCITAPSQTNASHTHVETAATTLWFAEPTDADIVAYAHTGEPLPCAGAFTLEAIGSWFIDRIDGDPSSVIGLSMPVVRRALYAAGYNASDFWNNSNHD